MSIPEAKEFTSSWGSTAVVINLIFRSAAVKLFTNSVFVASMFLLVFMFGINKGWTGSLEDRVVNPSAPAARLTAAPWRSPLNPFILRERINPSHIVIRYCSELNFCSSVGLQFTISVLFSFFRLIHSSQHWARYGLLRKLHFPRFLWLSPHNSQEFIYEYVPEMMVSWCSSWMIHLI